MTVFVLRDGRLVEKCSLRDKECPAKHDLPTPMISRFEAMREPGDGQDISSWRERDRDMDAAGCVDPRDLPTRAVRTEGTRKCQTTTT